MVAVDGIHDLINPKTRAEDGCLCGSEQGCHQSPVPGCTEGHGGFRIEVLGFLGFRVQVLA